MVRTKSGTQAESECVTDVITSLQIIFVSKQVIFLARDKFRPDKKPVWSDKTCFNSITCLCQLVLWSSNKICCIFVHKLQVTFDSFYIGSQMPCHSVRPGEDFASQNLNFNGQYNFCPMTDCYLQPCSYHILVHTPL